MGNTAVVHTLTLSATATPFKTPRYILARPSRFPAIVVTLLLSLIVVIVALLWQSYTTTSPGSPLLPSSLHEWMTRAQSSKLSFSPSASERVLSVPRRLRDTVGLTSGGSEEGTPQAVMVEDGQDEMHVHVRPHATVQGEGKLWEELSSHEQKHWKQRLSNSGQWAAEEGEAILKGIFFGEMAHVVGEAMAG